MRPNRKAEGRDFALALRLGNANRRVRHKFPVGSWSLGFLFSLAALLLESPAHSQTVAARLEEVFAKLPDRKALVGACVINLGSGQVAFSHNADAALTPASTMKSFVMAAALETLGADFVFHTCLATNGRDLAVIGDGDPTFGDEKIQALHKEPRLVDFDRWADALIAGNMARIPGDLIVDESIFDEQWVHPTWDRKDLDNWYAAPVGGLNINGNCLDIRVDRPASKGSPARIIVEPPNSVARIVDRCRVSGKGPPVLNHAAASMEYILNGNCSKPFEFGAVSFPDPGLLFADSLRTVFASRGIVVQGQIRRLRIRQSAGQLPVGWTVVGRREAKLLEALTRIGKDSQNLFAECVLKRTGYEWLRSHRPDDAVGSWKAGAQAIHDLLSRAGISDVGLIVADGSGLSRENRCTSRQLASLLAWMFRNKNADVFRESLSQAGVDGSMGKRLKDVRGKVFSKTGTMRGVRSLAGYVLGDAPGEDSYAFAVMFNQYKGTSAPFKDVEDRMCRILAAAPSSSKTSSSKNRSAGK